MLSSGEDEHIWLNEIASSNQVMGQKGQNGYLLVACSYTYLIKMISKE